MWYYDSTHPLRRLFSGLTEHAFLETLGIGDPKLIDYVSLLLSRFIHMDAVHRLRNAEGKRLGEVVEMLQEAEALPPNGATRREYYRHIGDFTLFWTGVFPEGLNKQRSAASRDRLIDYTQQGKRSYYIASTFEDDPYRDEAPVLRRLSEEFELCAFGLQQVRQDWVRSAQGQPPQKLL
jgi:hypothetical protein